MPICLLTAIFLLFIPIFYIKMFFTPKILLFLHQNFAFFTPKFCFFYTKFLNLKDDFLKKNDVKKVDPKLI